MYPVRRVQIEMNGYIAKLQVKISKRNFCARDVGQRQCKMSTDNGTPYTAFRAEYANDLACAPLCDACPGLLLYTLESPHFGVENFTDDGQEFVGRYGLAQEAARSYLHGLDQVNRRIDIGSED